MLILPEFYTSDFQPKFHLSKSKVILPVINWALSCVNFSGNQLGLMFMSMVKWLGAISIKPGTIFISPLLCPQSREEYLAQSVISQMPLLPLSQLFILILQYSG